MDRRADALRGGDSGPILVPKKSAESRLFELVSGHEPNGLVMPPKGERLTKEQAELIRRWIDEGADWPADPDRARHWSFQPVRRPEAPKVKDPSWARGPIDAFILSRLEKEGIKPSPEADRVTLLRRLSLDLTGLPPTLEEADRFLADRTPDAYAKMVDHYLASPRFGEQWARHWLDLARYADSDGYEKDLYRPHAWRWRDWVIDALNADLPFDQFTIQQIAGDLLPNATTENRVATGFHRNTLLNREGGVDIEEDRVKAVVDRVSTVGSAWLGLTLGCAECHSHKYDPISQREFYQLYAFFNSTEDRDVVAPLPRLAPKVEEARRLFAEIQKQTMKRLEADPALAAEFAAWRMEIAALPALWRLPESYELPTFGANNGANLYPQEDGSFLVTGTVGGATHYIMMSNLKLDGITAVRVEALTDPMLPKRGPGWAPNGNFVLSELRVEAAPLSDVNALKNYPIERAAADYGQPSLEIEKAIDGNEKTGWAVDLPHLPIHGVDRCAVFTLKEPIKLGAPLRLKVSLVQSHGQSHTLGRLRVSYATAKPEQALGQTTPQPIRDLLQRPYEKLNDEEKCRVLHYWLATRHPKHDLLKSYAESLSALLKAEGETRGPTLSERQAKRPTHIHIRGEFLQKGDVVAPGLLAAVKVPGFQANEKTDAALTRLDLARWLAAPENPLTSRVAANRIWKHLFGEGLVPSLGDFGAQGDPPSHPELLEWLAADFVAKGWSQKQLIRQIVLSNSYRQSSASRPELNDRDARNRLLARQNRFRLTAENVRDQLLAASGLLDGAVGGPSVPPSAPRRGLYVQLKRAHPEPLLVTFDAPGGAACCAKRERSNTPLQALSLLNDQLYVEAARRLARSAVETQGEDERLIRMFRQTLTRAPTAEELATLRRLIVQARKAFAADEQSAAEFIGKGWPKACRPAEAAAFAVAARAILNLDEVVTRE